MKDISQYVQVPCYTGEELRNKRKLLSLTLEDVARFADCTPGAISNIESGKTSNRWVRIAYSIVLDQYRKNKKSEFENCKNIHIERR